MTSNNSVYIILTGNVEMIQVEFHIFNRLSAGAIIGLVSGMLGVESNETYRADGYVNVLEIPAKQFFYFVKQYGLSANIEYTQDRLSFLQSTNLFGEFISYKVLGDVINNMQEYIPTEYDKKLEIESDNLLIIQFGKVKKYCNGELIGELGDGDYFKLDFNSDGFSEIFQGGTFYGVGVKQYIDSTQYIVVGCDNVFPHDYQSEVLLNLGGTFYWSGAGVPDVKLYWPPADSTPVAENVAINALNVYPNPATTNIYVENNTGATIEIYNLVGQKVKTVANANRNAIVNVEDLSEGTYIVKVIDGNEVKTAKVNIVK
jgi:hypothetical protein